MFLGEVLSLMSEVICVMVSCAGLPTFISNCILISSGDVFPGVEGVAWFEKKKSAAKWSVLVNLRKLETWEIVFKSEELRQWDSRGSRRTPK